MAALDLNYARTMARASEVIADWLVRYRVLLILVFALLTVLLGYRASLLRMDPGFDKSIPMSHEYMQTFARYKDDFGGANNVLIALMHKDGDIFDPQFLDVLDKATRDVIYTTGVDRAWVKSLFTPNVFFMGVNEEGFFGARIVPSNFSPTPEGIDEVRRNLLMSKEVGRLVSHDMSGALISALLLERDPATGEKLDYEQVGGELEAIREKYESENVTVHVIGFAKFISDVMSGARDVVLFFVATLIFTGVMLFFFSGSLQITILALTVALVAVVWQLGIVQMLGYGIDPLSILVPFLILAIGISHAVQMTNTWKQLVLAGDDSVGAARESFNRLFIPGTTALLSDAVGFAVIMLIDIDIIHELGITASIGVGVMIITNKFLLPALLCYARLSPKRIARMREKALETEKPLWRALSRTANRNVPVLVVVALLVAAGYWKGQDLIIGDSEAGAPELYPDSPYNRDVEKIVSNFNVAIDELMIVAETVEQGCVEFDVLDNIDRFDWHMQNIEGVQSVQTLAKVVKERMVGNSEGNWKYYSIPRNRYSAGNTIADRSMNINQQHFKYDCTAVPLRIYMQDHRAPTLRRAVDAVADYAEQNDTDRVQFRLASGNAGIMAA
ncbi:MAG: MMPL family transporter, partial [Pseudomonadota bacterium]|nr:MMPL family transporter [Pseudomonadota bacterium]